MSVRRQVISGEADVSEANVKRANASGRNRNCMRPEAAHAVERAAKARKTVRTD